MWSHSSTDQYINTSKGSLEGIWTLQCWNTVSNSEGLEQTSNQPWEILPLALLFVNKLSSLHNLQMVGDRHENDEQYTIASEQLSVIEWFPVILLLQGNTNKSFCLCLAPPHLCSTQKTQISTKHQTESCHPSVYNTPRAAAAIRRKCRILVSAFGSFRTPGTIYLYHFVCMTFRLLSAQKIIFWNESKMNLLVSQVQSGRQGNPICEHIQFTWLKYHHENMESWSFLLKWDLSPLSPLPQVSETSITPVQFVPCLDIISTNLCL